MDPKHLRRLSLETDEQHREAMRTIDDDLREVHLGTSDPALAASRRGFLRRAMSSSTVVAFGTAGFTLPVLLGTGTAAAQSNAGNTGGTGGTAPPGTSAGPTTTVEPNSVLPDAELELLREWAPKLVERLRKVPIIKDVASDQQTAGLLRQVIIFRAEPSFEGMADRTLQVEYFHGRPIIGRSPRRPQVSRSKPNVLHAIAAARARRSWSWHR